VKSVHRVIDYLSFEDWVHFVFDHPAEGQEWYWGNEAPFWNAPAELTAKYITRPFEAPLPALEGFRDPTSLTVTSRVGYPSMPFATCGGTPCRCMAAPVLADRQALQLAALETMAAILRLDSIACQESALHGLGHWHRVFPEAVESGIDEYLSLHPSARPELLTYARGARWGCIL
jgi:hypothetical protein